MIYPENYKKDLNKEKYEFIERNINGNFHFLFMGLTGTGKTMLADIIYRYIFNIYALDNWFTAEWVDANAMYQNYLDTMHSNADRTKKIKNCLSASLSVLDDMGFEPNTEASRQFMSTLLHIQYDSIIDGKCKYSIITTNLNAEEIAGRYGNRLYSRLTEHYTMFEFNGEDKRPKNNDKFYLLRRSDA